MRLPLLSRASHAIDPSHPFPFGRGVGVRAPWNHRGKRHPSPLGRGAGGEGLRVITAETGTPSL